MKWKRNQSKFGKTPVPETPYQRAGQKEDRRLGRANARGNRWCLAFCGAMGLAALSTSGLIYQSAQASIVPWVVEVDESGAVKASGPAQTNFKPSDAQIAHQLARFIPAQHHVEDTRIQQQFFTQLVRDVFTGQQRQRGDLGPFQLLQQKVFAKAGNGRDEDQDFRNHHEDGCQNQKPPRECL